MLTDQDILPLLQQIAQKDCEKSYRNLFVLMHESLTQFAASILQSREDAEEVVSDFFIKIWQKRHSIGLIEHPKLYFFVSVKNLAINKLAQNKRKQLSLVDEWQTNVSGLFFNPEELMISEEHVAKIMLAINTLPPKCKLIFKLIKEEGMKYADVAQLLQLSIKTVEAQMAIAIKRLKEQIEFKNEFPELHFILSKNK